MSDHFVVSGNLVDIAGRRVFPASVEVQGGKISRVSELPGPLEHFLLPGFIDAHIHIESSMLPPSEFARAACTHGTVAVVCDPHEIANVLGVRGVQYMLDDAARSPMKIFFGAPACVPATTFETSGDCIDAAEVARLLDRNQIHHLSEVMNVPGVLAGEPQVAAKIQAARDRGKLIDGHAPGLRGPRARRYFDSGISTDHECVTLEEAYEKREYGCKIIIREGSAARNLDALFKLLFEHSDQCMFCSDDNHPDDLLAGHIDRLVHKAVARGVDVMDALQAACLTPVEHYKLNVGRLRPGDDADFVEVDDLRNLRVKRTWIDGSLVAEHGSPTRRHSAAAPVNRFACDTIDPEQLEVRAATGRMNVIVAKDGQLITDRGISEAHIVGGLATSDTVRDNLKLVVVNRYQPAPPAVAFVNGFGLQRGAIASSVAHDSHNLIAVGTSDEEISAALNRLMEAGGGLAVVNRHEQDLLPLPIAGLMATAPYDDVATKYSQLDKQVKQLGSTLRAPFMMLSFMALLVIPSIKLSDRGLFDGERFEFVPLFV